jgi:hypothetical protein
MLPPLYRYEREEVRTKNTRRINPKTTGINIPKTAWS